MQLAYAIGVAHPVSFVSTPLVQNTFAEQIRGSSASNLDLRPAGIIKCRPQASIYRQTAAYGHMGRTDIDLP